MRARFLSARASNDVRILGHGASRDIGIAVGVLECRQGRVEDRVSDVVIELPNLDVVLESE